MPFTALHAKALTIDLTDVGSSPMSDAQMAAFEAATAQREGLFIDSITVNVSVRIRRWIR